MASSTSLSNGDNSNNCSIKGTSVDNAARMQIWNTYNFRHPCCHFCSGFYGCCYGEPVCPTCHAFLYPDDINAADSVPLFEDKTDDDDSGNEEPTDFGNGFGNNSRLERPRCPASKPDKLTERIKALSVAAKYNNKCAVSEEILSSLPAEVLLIIFSFLDDISLWSCAQVCTRWQNLIYTETNQEHWKQLCRKRWPLFSPRCSIHGWKALYTWLIRSTPCLLCLCQMTVQVHLPAEENSWRRDRLRSELKALRIDPPEGIEAVPLDKHFCHWQACIAGPVGSSYEGGCFYIYLQIPHGYPMKPPVVRFITKIFHPNVSRHGDIGIDSIHHNWSLALTISKVLISIQSLLTDPFCQVCMEPQMGRLYSEDRDTFDRLAKSWTKRYATPPHENILLSADFCKSLESGC